MTDQSIDRTLGMLLGACADDGAGPRGLPASPDQIAALERHWGRSLPPLYRRLLAMHNGVPRLWFDVALLSIGTIIDGSREMRAFEATAPAHWRWIFACGTESRDALAFDPSQASDDGELPVVHLGEAGVVARWPSLAAVLQDLFSRLVLGTGGRGTTTWYLWTGLWPYWAGSSSPDSRVFAARDNSARYAGRGGLFVQRCDVDRGRLLPEYVLVEADRRFADAVRELGTAEPRLAIVLTEAPAEPAATQGYVYYEPCADLVISLSTVERQASMCATDALWAPWGASFASVIASTTALIKQDRLGDALLHAIDETFALVRSMRGGARRA
jgi:hypothetical protein